jgi:hypothetical protein
VGFALGAESTALTGGFADVGWRFATPTEELFRSFTGREETRLCWWHAREGLLLAWEDEWDEGRFLLTSLVACAAQALPALLLDLRALAARDGFHAVGWHANFQPALVEILAGAGFTREGDGSGFVFERRHPAQP